jgi:hypothetical protein
MSVWQAEWASNFMSQDELDFRIRRAINGTSSWVLIGGHPARLTQPPVDSREWVIPEYIS